MDPSDDVEMSDPEDAPPNPEVQTNTHTAQEDVMELVERTYQNDYSAEHFRANDVSTSFLILMHYIYARYNSNTLFNSHSKTLIHTPQVYMAEEEEDAGEGGDQGNNGFPGGSFEPAYVLEIPSSLGDAEEPLEVSTIDTINKFPQLCLNDN